MSHQGMKKHKLMSILQNKEFALLQLCIQYRYVVNLDIESIVNHISCKSLKKYLDKIHLGKVSHMNQSWPDKTGFLCMQS